MITIGADPEFFVRNRRHFISGHMFPCGTKQLPVKTTHGHVQVDGIALEVNVKPATTRQQFITNVLGVVNDATTIMNNTMKGCELVARPSIFFGRSKLDKLPHENSELGCTPDWNAYTARLNPRPNASSPIRTGAGHIHIGFEDAPGNPRSIAHIQKCARLARQLDFYLGLPSLLWDKDHRRRSLYGKAGAFRPKPYGIEYRVLSNAWVTTKNDLIGWVFDQTIRAINDFNNGKYLPATYIDIAKSIIDAPTFDPKYDWRKTFPGLARDIL